MNDLKDIKSLLLRPGVSVSDLKPTDLVRYVDYRLSNLKKERLVLLKKEQDYLLGETGNGSLRFDPDLIELIAIEDIVYKNGQKNIGTLLKAKKEINKYLIEDSASEETNRLIKNGLESHFGSLKQISSPLRFVGSINNVRFVIYWFSDSTLAPSKEFFRLLRLAKQSDLVPVFIARKVHGVLFPFLKQVGASGFNTYTSLVTPSTASKFTDDNEFIANLIPDYNLKISFNSKVTPVDSFFSDNASINVFLNNYLPKLLSESKFLAKDYNYKAGFKSCLESMPRNRTVEKLLTWENRRRVLINGLNRVYKAKKDR